MFDWQTILVVGALLLAGTYVGRRGWLRLSSFARSRAMSASSCAQGCGGCGARQQIEIPKTNVIQIMRSQVGFSKN
jgi:hypothetical protein